jgi:hypothetical protein
MKEIMYNESTSHDSGIASFGYSDADASTPYLNMFAFAFEDFKTDLCNKFGGQTLRMEDIYRRHNVGTPYISRNYKKALNELEVEKRVAAEPAFHTRKIQKGKRTFPNGTIVRFPARSN